uniref:Serine/threonine-protein kinase HipA n=1 Tax=Candidatus Kentrum sp. DK TaxID=2126562 RepID=A0A450SYU5_9GAMM|nr:MAG: serine/threonine-protein kinase HipA [Candidatus Kentron sp. DK]
MARNQHAVLWTRISGKPEKMGDLVLSEARESFTYSDLLLSEARASFTYVDAYLNSGQPGFCLLGDGGIWGQDTVWYPISERIPVFPRLLSLIPGQGPRNLQRRQYLDMLRTQLGREPAPGLETEWRLLVMGGHGGIGHVDIFSDDITAYTWYQARDRFSEHGITLQGAGARSELWHMLKHEVLDENVDFDPRIIEGVLGPTPSVGGMIPKLLVSLDTENDNPLFFPPETPGHRNVVLKIEPPEYAGLLDLEALCLDIHREAGFEVPEYHRYDDGALHFIAVERFDRIGGKPIPLESLFSIIATGDHHFRETGDLMLEELGGIISRLGDIAGVADDTQEQLYRRLLMALLTGNGDLHLDNLSIMGELSQCRLAPIYDPSPMRAWPRHNLVSAIPFDAPEYSDHGALFIHLGATFGLSPAQIRRCIEESLAVTADFPEQVLALGRVPEHQRTQLVDIARQERGALIRAVQF